MRILSVVVAATFTGEPVEPGLAFWLRKLGFEARIAFAPYNQLFQQLADPAGAMARNQAGLNVFLIRLEDWAGADPDSRLATVERNVKDFAKALDAFAASHGRPHLVVCCPPSRGRGWDTGDAAERLGQCEKELAATLSASAGIQVVPSDDLLSACPGLEYYDPFGEAMGHIPYTTAFFGVLAKRIARSLFLVSCPPHKVVVLDCDNTLWEGVVGEDGVHGVEIDAARKHFQAFMAAQAESGMLICLCSKNNEKDVWEVFDQRSDMVLRKEHIMAARVNWKPKSENLISLAEELSLGLDSFVFFDESALECAEVRANCPEVLTLQVPQDPGQIAGFLQHIWAFDHLTVTKEDAARTALYKENLRRESVRRQTSTLAEFISTLDLQVDIGPLDAATLARASQLTQRTNQFNATTVRRTESEMQQLVAADDHVCSVVHVKDRFGDYGLVGLTIAQVRKDVLSIDTLLLSCRALGRGVEHRMVAALGSVAMERGLGAIEIPFVPTARNQPALDFLEGLPAAAEKSPGGGQVYRLPAAQARSVTPATPGTMLPPAAVEDDRKPAAASGDQAGQRQAVVAGLTLAAALRDPGEILLAIESSDIRPRRVRNEYIEPGTVLDKAIAAIWSQVLNVERIGIEDNFMELGGDSLQTAICTNRLQEALGAAIYVSAIFDAPTVAALSSYLRQHYPDEVRRFEGRQGDDPGRQARRRVDSEMIARFRAGLLAPAATEHHGGIPRGPRARRVVFVLCPYRSGSTLLRVMLGGSPSLFAPPELELLAFSTLAERRSVLSGKYAFAADGPIRALMESRQCEVDEAAALMRSFDEKNLTIGELYSELSETLNGRVLVDKSPSNSLDDEALKRAEQIVESPYYIHLVRHPIATIRSFVDVRIDRVLWKLKEEDTFPVRELGELVWFVSHDNATRFLETIPESRKHRIRFEDLVTNPREVMIRLCESLNAEFSEEMLQPYADRRKRMTDGIRESASSRMMGDLKFHQHKDIDASVARTVFPRDEWEALGPETRALARQFGYEPA